MRHLAEQATIRRRWSPLPLARPLLGLICGLGLACSGRSALALDVGRRLTQFHHTAWTIADGAPPDVWALAQSSDGFLWLGTGAGLFRFDGLRFENVRPDSGPQAPSSNINSLYSASSGDLWIGYSDGALSLLRQGRLSNFSLNTPGAAVSTIIQDRSGAIWASLEGPGIGALGRFEKGRWQVMGPDRGVPRGAIYSAMASRDGSVWITTGSAILVHHPGAKAFVLVGPPISEGAHLTEGPDGRIWVSKGANGLHPWARLEGANGDGAQAHALQTMQPAGLNARRSLFDRDGALWGADMKGGVFRLAHPSRVPDAQSPALRELDRFTMANGLSSELSGPLLEDHEGDLWVGTNLGLDRFRPANVVTEESIPATAFHGFEAAIGDSGRIYVTTDTTLYEVRPLLPTRTIASLPTPATFIYPDRDGQFWIGQNDGLLRLSQGHLYRVNLPPAAIGRTLSWLQFRSGEIWISVRGKGVFRQAGGRWRRVVIPGTPPNAAPAQMRLDQDGQVWLSFGRGLQRLEGSRLHDFSAVEGLSVGDVNIITPTPQGIVVGGDFGIARFDGKRFRCLTSDRFPAFTRVSGIVQTAKGETWLNTIKGVTRVSNHDLAAAFADPSQPLRLQTFDLADGLPGVAQQDAGTPTALQASDGRIWFVTSHGMAWMDPAHINHNLNPPPVSILALIADGRQSRLPLKGPLQSGVSNIEIDYTALSLADPRRVKFLYRLAGVDPGWIDPGARRQAFYTKLSPGRYRFQVIASNNDNVWNRTGATLEFEIPPTFLQSGWFALVCLVLGLMTLWSLYAMRMRQVASQVRLGLEERLAERDRIARELHDTLLQGFQGLVLNFEAATDSISPEQPARKAMRAALDRADGVLIEARDRVLELRSTGQSQDLSQLLTFAAEKMSLEPRIALRVVVEGAYRDLHPVVLDEVFRIADEALFNVIQHSEASRVDVSITYHPRELRVHIRDDGKGIDPDVLARGRLGHFGLSAMRERAARIQADFVVSSRVGAGTEVGLVVPANAAYVKPRRSEWGVFRRRRRSVET